MDRRMAIGAAPVIGTDPAADNYDPAATIDDGDRIRHAKVVLGQ